ncbi:hypothetical protein J2129_002270 [Methanofollis sp. W23]|nr:hypothetical protein [Methanofollis sp. W23]
MPGAMIYLATSTHMKTSILPEFTPKILNPLPLIFVPGGEERPGRRLSKNPYTPQTPMMKRFMGL